jgi:hypothetical protein
MSATKELSAGVHQVIGTDWAILNDSDYCWWVAKVVDGIGLDPNDCSFFMGTWSEVIQYAHELHMSK